MNLKNQIDRSNSWENSFLVFYILLTYCKAYFSNFNWTKSESISSLLVCRNVYWFLVDKWANKNGQMLISSTQLLKRDSIAQMLQRIRSLIRNSFMFYLAVYNTRADRFCNVYWFLIWLILPLRNWQKRWLFFWMNLTYIEGLPQADTL